MLDRVAIVGGTHGNEWSGIYLIQHLQTQGYPFKVETFLANPGAVAANRRYLDQDLNRSFLPTDLRNLSLKAYEAQRAKVLAPYLQGADLLIDLHNTTANMGLTLIFSQANAFDDPLTRQLCAHALKQDARVRLYHNPVLPELNPYLPSVAQREITLEVGPQAHGCLNAELYMAMQKIVASLLDYLAQWQQGNAPHYQETLTVYTQVSNVDYPRSLQGELTAMIHPDLQGRDFEALSPGDPLFLTFQGHTIPYMGTETVYPVFINEQAYYEKHFALSLTRSLEYMV